MRETLEKLLEKLAVNYVLSPYETMPWSHYDEEKGLTCSAEVRMGPGGDDIEAEIQFLHDEKDEDEETDSGGEEGETSPQIVNGREQILWMRAEPAVEDKWSPKALRIKGKDYVNEFHDWDVKGCEFFSSCVQAIQMGEIPDVDELEENTMKDDSWGGRGGRRGKVGRKSPKIKPAQLMGMKK